MIEAALPLAATLAGVTALGFWLEGRFPWAGKLGASLLIIALGALLSNLGLLPAASPVYDFLMGPVTSLAIVWLLLAVDLRCLREVGPAMLGAFLAGVLGTALGAAAAFALFADAFPGVAWRLAGVMTGTYSGGGLNFVAVGRAVELPDSIYAAATAADNVVTSLWMGCTLLVPVWLGAAVRGRTEEVGRETRRGRVGFFDAVPLRPADLAWLLLIGLGLLAAAAAIADRLPAVPEVLWLTTLALAAAQLPAIRRLRGAAVLGGLALNLFFAVLGALSRIEEILRVGVEVFLFAALVVAVHGLVLFGVARLRRWDVETTAVASQAAVGGPSTAMALAAARRRPDLAAPGVMAGLLGYALGNYAGIGLALALRALG